ncbi:MAG: 50S ribosomal protein L9 [Patescibacteria group bacterium]
MQIILNKDVAKLGYRGELVKVKNGYFRNFLQPKGFAEIATESGIKLAGIRKGKILLKKTELLEKAKEALARLKDLKVTFKKKATTKGKLFGAITEMDVIKAIEESKQVKLEKEWIKMEHIKTVGEHAVKISLGDDLDTNVTVEVKAA